MSAWKKKADRSRTGRGGRIADRRKICRTVLLGIMVFLITGCRDNLSGRIDPGITLEDNRADSSAEKEGDSTAIDDTKIIEAVYEEICGRAETIPGSLEEIRGIVEGLGAKGYAAVDGKNQINMVCPEQIRSFGRQVEARKEAEAELVVVVSAISFVRYEFTTAEGTVTVRRSFFLRQGEWEMVSSQSYPACTWVYSGAWLFFGEYNMPGYDGPSGQTAVRVEPLEEECRQLNRNYVRRIGYELNNLFTADWSESDYRDLNLYDLYEAFLRIRNAQQTGALFEEGRSYEIPAAEFEAVFQSFFRIDVRTLRQYTTYHESMDTYRYRTRGMFDFAPTPNIPEPEVVAYEKNPDGTLRLTVNAVWTEKCLERAFCHEVTVRPLEDGSFQYVSNRVLHSENDVEITWYTERLTEEQWAEYYEKKAGTETEDENTKDAAKDVAKEPAGESAEKNAKPDNILTAAEEMRLQKEAMAAAERCAEYYRDSSIIDAETGYSRIDNFSAEQRKAVVHCLGGQGLVSVSDDINMENGQQVEAFYDIYASGGDAMVTVFEVYREGDLCAKTFISRDGKTQSYYVLVGWREGGVPRIKGDGTRDLEEMRLTEKGYFIYTNTVTAMHGSLRDYYRVKPLSESCRKLTDRYLYGLSFVNYSLLAADWDADTVEAVLEPCMFEDLYRAFTREPFVPENGRIPAQTYEQVMTTCLPVTVEQLREHCGYDGETDSYEYEMIFSRQFPPFGEVVDYREQEDGTLILTVDVVWIDRNSDQAFTDQIVVQPFADGTFRYLSNSVEEKELSLPARADRTAFAIPAALLPAAPELPWMLTAKKQVLSGTSKKPINQPFLS